MNTKQISIMATITPNIAPGSYMDPQTITFTFSADISGVAITKNAAPPSISKYIAYDTLTPANPFLAVTEDGRGRVVYDGGFPKFYNNYWNGATTFAELNSQFKYLYNAINFVQNQSKVEAGNKKILLLGDATTDAPHYAVKSISTTQGGFYTSFTGLCAMMGYPLTIKDRYDYGTQLDARLSELEQYACVILMSSIYSSGTSYITPQCINDLVTYRENGNGLIVISDHGPILENIDAATANLTGFFSTANQLLIKFGSYFSGDYNRTPVNVGFLRSTYGDHPLYNGLTDAENMPAGGSESRVFVSPSTIVAPGSVSPVIADTTGLNTINILATLSDGSVITSRIVYNIQGQEFVFMKSINRNTSIEEINAGVCWTDLAGKASILPNIDGSTLGTVWGEILLQGKRIGEVYYSGGISNIYWYAGSAANTPVRNSDTLQIAISIPFSYSKSLTANRVEPTKLNKSIALNELVKDDRSMYGITGMNGMLLKMYNAISDYLPVSLKKQKISKANNASFLRDFTFNRLQTVTSLSARIYKTTALTTAAVSASAATPGTVIIDGSTNTVYAYKNGSIQAITGLKMQDFFGSPRIITSTVDGAQYRLEINGSVTAL